MIIGVVWVRRTTHGDPFGYRTPVVPLVKSNDYSGPLVCLDRTLIETTEDDGYPGHAALTLDGPRVKGVDIFYSIEPPYHFPLVVLLRVLSPVLTRLGLVGYGRPSSHVSHTAPSCVSARVFVCLRVEPT